MVLDEVASLFVVVTTAVVVAVASELKLTNVGSRENSFPSVQQLFVSPQQYLLPDPPGQSMTWLPWLEDPPALITTRISMVFIT